MTARELAKSECANYEPDGGCLGVGIGGKGEISHCNPKPRCVLSAGEQCAYFEECVAPLANIVTEPCRAKAIREAVHSYRMAHVAFHGAERKCPDCGGPLQKFRQVCPGCADKRRKATFRDSQSRRRQNDVALSTEVPNKTTESLGNSPCFPASSQKPYADSPYRRHIYTLGRTRIEALKGEKAHPGRLFQWQTQGSVADILNSALVEILNEETKYGWRLLFPVHDSAYVVTRNPEHKEAIGDIFSRSAKGMRITIGIETTATQKGT